jgi:NADPH-dependent 7-cyano-7-deazaguanine reductase QueF
MTTTADHDRADRDAALARLGREALPQDLPELNVFDGPASLTTVTLQVGRLAKRCPSTGRPDQFDVEVAYAPTGGRCLEVDSLVRHLEAFHEVEISAERLADRLAAAVLEVTGAGWVEVTVHQTGREGAELHVTARHPTTATGDPGLTATDESFQLCLPKGWSLLNGALDDLFGTILAAHGGDKVAAAVEVGRDLMRGDPAQHRAGCCRDSAVLAIARLYGPDQQEQVRKRLPEEPGE